jgi:hypothetical protein
VGVDCFSQLRKRLVVQVLEVCPLDDGSELLATSVTRGTNAQSFILPAYIGLLVGAMLQRSDDNIVAALFCVRHL